MLYASQCARAHDRMWMFCTSAIPVHAHMCHAHKKTLNFHRCFILYNSDLNLEFVLYLRQERQVCLRIVRK